MGGFILVSYLKTPSSDVFLFGCFSELYNWHLLCKYDILPEALSGVVL